MAAESSVTSGPVKGEAPVSESEEQDRAHMSQDAISARAKHAAAQPRTSSPRAWRDPEAVNSIRPRRTRERTNEERRKEAPVAATKDTNQKFTPERTSAAGDARPPPASTSTPGDLWTLPQSVRDRFIQDKRRFYFPDGAPAFRDHGRRLTTGSENTEVIRSLVEIAQTRGWEEITVAGTKRFRQEAWRQGRLAGLEVRGYRPTAPERASVVRSLARHGQGAQMELGVSESGLEPASAVREDTPPSGAAGADARRARDLIVGKLIDHGRDSYRFDPHESMSYFIEIGTSHGKRIIWGKDLDRAMKQSLTQPQIGDEIGIRRTGAEPVTVQRRERDADGRVIAEREVGVARNRWVVEKREFFEARAAAAGVLRDPNVDRRQAVRQHPELVGTYLQLHAAQLAARRIRDPQDREKFVALVRAALADSVARGDALQPVRLRDRAGRAPERKPLEREPGPARA